ncbi:LysR family transcriptional regulator [Cystobacter fuscus]|uniref:LysR substrate-binding domain-containing protein n=1 Tax=Cystobacter fuscus TaxID=43 RepID=UPI002B28821F|nr:LysR family transcriptional regulator [Cystobacter fuscus]
MDRFDAMRVFTRIVELGSFTKAATDLGLPRATVTLAVQQLESRLGARLLHRTTREVSATPEGQLYYRRCTRVLSEVEDAEAELAQGAGKLRGKVRIHMVTGMAAHVVIPALPDFHERYPRIDVEVGTGDRAVDLAREGVDCALRAGVVDTPHLVVRRLAPMPQATFASTIYLARKGEPRSLEALERHWAVNYVEAATGKPYPLDFVVRGELKKVVMNGVLTVMDSEAYVSGCLAHFGLIQVPAYRLAAHVADGRLREVLPNARPPPLPLALVHPYQRKVPPRVRLFMDWLAALCAKQFGTSAEEAPAGD